MTSIDDIGLPFRAQGALKKAFKSAEEAAVKNDEELLAVKGFGKTGLARLRQWEKETVEEQAPGEPQRMDLGAGPLTSEQIANAFVGPRWNRDDLAVRFFDKLAENAVPSDALLGRAFELADHFRHLSGQGGKDVIITDGMTVYFNGQQCILRTKFGHGEVVPKEDRVAALALVKAP